MHTPRTRELLPYTQVTIRIQGTRNTSRQALAQQLSVIALQIADGHPSGSSEVDECGYVFQTEMLLDGPSIFAGEKDRLQPGSLAETVSRQLGQQAVTRLTEMSPVHRAVLERHFGFAVHDSRNLHFLNNSDEEAVLAEAFRLLARHSKAEQRNTLKSIGLDGDLP